MNVPVDGTDDTIVWPHPNRARQAAVAERKPWTGWNAFWGTYMTAGVVAATGYGLWQFLTAHTWAIPLTIPYAVALAGTIVRAVVRTRHR